MEQLKGGTATDTAERWHSRKVATAVRWNSSKVEQLQGGTAERAGCLLHGVLCLQVEIEKYRVENVTAEDVRHKNMSQLDQRLTETREQADWYQHKHDAAVKRVDQLKVGLASEQSTANP